MPLPFIWVRASRASLPGYFAGSSARRRPRNLSDSSLSFSAGLRPSSLPLATCSNYLIQAAYVQIPYKRYRQQDQRDTQHQRQDDVPFHGNPPYLELLVFTGYVAVVFSPFAASTPSSRTSLFARAFLIAA
jgi:hypothetical protein